MRGLFFLGIGMNIGLAIAVLLQTYNISIMESLKRIMEK